MISVIRSRFECYGFSPLETPALEYLDILMGKYGEEGDKLIYRLDYKGGKVAGMKYDLTIPLARVVSQHKYLTLPFKRYQIQPVWRADRPQPNQGRFREFYQCDADIVGVDSVLADVEIIAMVNDILEKLDIGRFRIRVNHRKILSGITEFVGLSPDKEIDLCRGIDKLDKVGMDGVREELSQHGFADDVMKRIFELLSLEGHHQEILGELGTMLSSSEAGSQGVAELKTIFTHLKDMDVPDDNLKLDLYLARGLDYYTGTIYESSSLELPHIGSLTGGGRYDRLIGSFGASELPAVGSTVGLDRIATVLSQLGKIEDRDSVTHVLVSLFDESLSAECMKLTTSLRNAGIHTELFYQGGKLKKQFSYADRKKIPYVLVFGPDEAANNRVTLKDLASGTQEELSREDLVTTLHSKLNK
ncbi:MAG: histidine--tRNA ligase, partial [Spirochaetota bacterium]|nr:histidine--tRNA ligase [Spirochaetota bacterium]